MTPPTDPKVGTPEILADLSPPQTTEIVLAPPPLEASLTAEEAERVRGLQRRSRAPRTWKEYQRHWRVFGAWCARKHLEPLQATPAHIALYLTDVSRNASLSTVRVIKAALTAAYEVAGHNAPPSAHGTVKTVVKGVVREKGVAPKTAKRELTMAELEHLLYQLPDPGTSMAGDRDRAILLVGFFGAFRREALVSLRVSDVVWLPWGATVNVRKDKSDQAGEGLIKKIPAREGPLNPAGALRAWITRLEAASALLSGPEAPLFPRVTTNGKVTGKALTPQTVALLVKRLARAAGFTGTALGSLSGHSLRIGFVTAAFDAGASIADVQAQTGHKRIETLLKYDRARTKRGNAVFQIGREQK